MCVPMEHLNLLVSYVVLYEYYAIVITPTQMHDLLSRQEDSLRLVQPSMMMIFGQNM